jgi:hypothetical protein
MMVISLEVLRKYRATWKIHISVLVYLIKDKVLGFLYAIISLFIQYKNRKTYLSASAFRQYLKLKYYQEQKHLIT